MAFYGHVRQRFLKVFGFLVQEGCGITELGGYYAAWIANLHLTSSHMAFGILPKETVGGRPYRCL